MVVYTLFIDQVRTETGLPKRLYWLSKSVYMLWKLMTSLSDSCLRLKGTIRDS